LVPADTNQEQDIFVHDLQTGETTRVSTGDGGGEANGSSYWASFSSRGRFVSFASEASNLVPADTNAGVDVFVHDRLTGETTRVSVSSSGDQAEGSGIFILSELSGNGRYVVFDSDATDLVSGDTNQARDVFVHDRLTATTERISVAADGSEGDDDSMWPAISPDGGIVVFTSDASNLVLADMNQTTDVFVAQYLVSPPPTS